MFSLRGAFYFFHTFFCHLICCLSWLLNFCSFSLPLEKQNFAHPVLFSFIRTNSLCDSVAIAAWVVGCCVCKRVRETHSGGVRCAVDDESVKPYMRLNEYRAGVRNQRRAEPLTHQKNIWHIILFLVASIFCVIKNYSAFFFFLFPLQFIYSLLLLDVLC